MNQQADLVNKLIKPTNKSGINKSKTQQYLYDQQIYNKQITYTKQTLSHYKSYLPTNPVCPKILPNKCAEKHRQYLISFCLNKT